ncbi:hypothetical protein LINPERPRIM_LOCUS32681 [Linum perenne]
MQEIGQVELSLGAIELTSSSVVCQGSVMGGVEGAKCVLWASFPAHASFPGTGLGRLFLHLGFSVRPGGR